MGVLLTLVVACIADVSELTSPIYQGLELCSVQGGVVLAGCLSTGLGPIQAQITLLFRPEHPACNATVAQNRQGEEGSVQYDVATTKGPGWRG